MNKIFYLDDDYENLEIFSHALKNVNDKQSLNYSLKIYTIGDNLLNDLRELKPRHALIFLDINMPIKTGFDILVEIRNDSDIKHLPVIMYSTMADSTSINTAIDLGANLYAVKPLLHKEITDLVRKISVIDWNNFSVEKKDFLIT